jgi:hypothetical protein
MASMSSESLVSPHIECALMEQHEAPSYTIKIDHGEHKWNERFHPSSDLLIPERELYNLKHPVIGPTYKRAPMTASSLIAVQLGTAIHAMFEALLVDLNLTTKEECEVYFREDTLGISGLCDIRNLILPDGRKILVDIKTCSKFPTSLTLSHRLQVALYMDLMEGAPHDIGTCLYIQKASPHKLKDIPIYMDDETQEELRKVYTRWSNVRKALAANDPSGLKETL